MARLPTEFIVLPLGYNQKEFFSTPKNPTDNIIITTSQIYDGFFVFLDEDIRHLEN